MSPDERREALKLVYQQARGCANCPELAATRTQVVFGAGNADADLMFVGEAPGANEDRLGRPFVGQAGELLETLLTEIGLTRPEVFISNVLLCRPPGNRDPHPVEIENCQGYLMRELELIQPVVVCTVGNFSSTPPAPSRRGSCAATPPASRACTASPRFARSASGRCGCPRCSTRPPRST